MDLRGTEIGPRDERLAADRLTDAETRPDIHSFSQSVTATLGWLLTLTCRPAYAWSVTQPVLLSSVGTCFI